MKIGVVVVALIAVALVTGGILYFSGKSPGQDSYDTGTNGTGTNAPSTGEEQQAAGTPKTYNITIQGSAFQTPLLTINAGDTVTWTNKDSMPHTVTSDSGSELNSPTLGGASSGGYYSQPKSGGKYSHTFTTAGTYDYHCSIHPGMKGTIVVG